MLGPKHVRSHMRRTATQSLVRNIASKSPCKVVVQIVRLNGNWNKFIYFFLKLFSIKFHTKIISVIFGLLMPVCLNMGGKRL